MADTVYIIGAGINRSIQDWNGLKPPLATDLFQQALKHPVLGDKYYRNKLKPVFDYIQRFWQLSIEQLENSPFNLEDCYTLIQFQASEAKQQQDITKQRLLFQIEYILTALLAEYLTRFSGSEYASDTFRTFGEIIYTESPVVVTFNYDTLLESAIEIASKPNPAIFASLSKIEEWTIDNLPDCELQISRHNWNRQLAYGIKFDEIIFDRPGIPLYVTGERFYSLPSNKLYHAPILKLHGSINWFYYTGLRMYEPFGDEEPENKAGKTILLKDYAWRINGLPHELSGEILRPILITPVLNKEFNQPIIAEIWNRAAEELSTCKRLIVGGYSFPPTDFNTKRLLLEAFSTHCLEEIIVINPDTRVVQQVKDLCHFRKPVLTCSNIDEFISLYAQSKV